MMYEDTPDDPPVPQEILQSHTYEVLEEVTRHDTQSDVQQGNSIHANNGEELNEALGEMNQNDLESSLSGLNDDDAIDQVSAFFEDAYWAGVSLDGIADAITSSTTEIENQQPSGENDLTEEQITGGLDLSDYETLVAFNHQFDLDRQVNADEQVETDRQIDLNDRLDINRQVILDHQVDHSHEAEISYTAELGPQLDKPIIVLEEQSEQEKSIDPVNTASLVNHLHIPDGSPYMPAIKRGEQSLGSSQLKHGAQKKKAVMRNTVSEKPKSTRSPAHNPQQYAGVKKAQSPKAKIVGAAVQDRMENLATPPDPIACTAEQAPLVQLPMDALEDMTLSTFLTLEGLEQIRSVAQDMAREEAKRVYTREVSAGLTKACTQYLRSIVSQQGLLLKAAYSASSQPYFSESFVLPPPTYGPPAHEYQSNAHPSPQATDIVGSNSSPLAGQLPAQVSPINHHQAPFFQAAAIDQADGFDIPQQNFQMIGFNDPQQNIQATGSKSSQQNGQITGFNVPQQNGQVAGLTFAQQYGQMGGSNFVQSASQIPQQGYQTQTQHGQQNQAQNGPQVSQQQQAYYAIMQQQPQQPLTYYAPSAAPHQATYRSPSQAQLVADQYRNQQMQQQQGQQAPPVQQNQQAPRAQRSRRGQQSHQIPQAQPHQPYQQANMYYQSHMQPSPRSYGAMTASQSAFNVDGDDLRAPKN